jgi:hypothetical protein
MSARKTYASLATVSAATLFLEIIVTRVFSVTLAYHFAFVAVSLAMLGMAGGAMYVYLHRERYQVHNSLAAIGGLTTYLAASMVLVYLLSLGVRFRTDPPAEALTALGLIVGLWMVPFFLSGAIVSIALTRTAFPPGKLYAADLIGGALGCLLVQPALTRLGPPASIGMAALLLVLVGECLLAGGQTERHRGRRWRLLLAAGLVAFVALGLAAPRKVSPRWIHGRLEDTPEQVFWNSYSRVAVFPPERHHPTGWGMGSNFRAAQYSDVTIRWENIDANAGTLVTQVGHDLSGQGYLTYDVTNAAYALREEGPVVVVGVGGGRDLLTALTMGRHTITGIELNPVLVRLLRKDYADFSGNIASNPRVRLVVGEARNWLERNPDTFDVIQISLIDTWAATASGAYCLSENTLYTVQAWQTFLKRLKPTGILSASRWSWETVRMVSLAEAALASTGQREPSRCVILLENILPPDRVDGVSTLLVSPSPFSPEDVRRIRATASQAGWRVLYCPTAPAYPYTELLDPGRAPAYQRACPADISAPSDDRPYFFNLLRPADLLTPNRWRQRPAMPGLSTGPVEAYVGAASVLGALTMVLVLATALLTVVPLYSHQGRRVWKRGDLTTAVYFAAIGLAFMLVEMALIQRTGIALGHPVYGLQVSLFSLLLGSGLGSLLSGKVPDLQRRGARLLLVALVAVTAAGVLGLSPFTLWLASTPQVTRIVAVAGLVLLMALFMGTAFPTGLALARWRGRDELLPWLWGTNGVFSVLGACLGTTCALFYGARVTGLLGAGFYAVACVAVWALTSRPPSGAHPDPSPESAAAINGRPTASNAESE